MRKLLVVALLVVLAVSVAGCGCGGETTNNGNNGGNVDYGGENPDAGKIISSTSTDPNALKPAKEKDLIGEMKVPPHPMEIWTLFQYDKTEVSGSTFKGWIDVKLNKETVESGLKKQFEYENNKEVTFKVSIKTDKAITSSDPATIKPMVEEWIEAIIAYNGKPGIETVTEGKAATIKESGEYLSTFSLVKGIWYTYELPDGKKGKVLAYALKGPRISETEFAPGTLVMAVAEGPAAAFDEAMEKGNLYYMFQELLVTQVTE